MTDGVSHGQAGNQRREVAAGQWRGRPSACGRQGAAPPRSGREWRAALTQGPHCTGKTGEMVQNMEFSPRHSENTGDFVPSNRF